MSNFNQMKVKELREVAVEFGVDVAENATKKVVLAALHEDGVTYQMWHNMHPEIEDDDDDETADATVVAEPKKKLGETILVKMERENGTYETHGYRFTKQHPFCLVDQDDFQEIMDMEDQGSFRQATPKEAAEFYS